MLKNKAKQPRQISHPKTTKTKDSSFVESNDNIKIFLRVKPQPANHPSTIRIINPQQIQIMPPMFSTQQDRIYNYQQVFRPQTTNLQVFRESMLEPIHNVMEGYNATLFVYGMTGAGKTHTMFNSSGEQVHKGLVDMALTRIFDQINQKQDKYEVNLSFFEIYNQNIRDLLSEKKQNLNIMEGSQEGVFIPELRSVKVQQTETAHKFIEEGMIRRARQATHHNQTSSRSHAILQISLRKYLSKQGQMSMQESKLFMVDLAGNERTSQNQTKRFLEGVNINKSLLTLGKCISILAEPKKASFIPYRDSKLTRILKQALGGNSKTAMIACVSPAPKYYEETLNTLKYSSKARKIKNTAKQSSIRKVSKDKLPRPVEVKVEKKMGLRHDEEQDLLSLVGGLEILLTEKVRAQSVKQQLEQCLLELPPQEPKIRELRQTIIKIERRIQQIDNRLEAHLSSFMSTVSQIKKEQQINNRQLSRYLNQQKMPNQPHYNISNQKGKQIQLTFTEPDQPDQPDLMPVCLSEQNIPRTKHPISIKVDQYKHNNNKQNICVNRLKRSNTSRSSFNSHSSFSQKNSQAIFKPIYDITKENFKLQSPTHRDPILIRSGSQHDSLRNSKQKFGVVLQQMDKNPSNFTSAQVAGLLDEYERQQYQLSIPEKSMISKLRFLLKNNQKQVQNTKRLPQPRKKALIL